MRISRELLISLERDGVGAILGPGGPEIKNGVLRELARFHLAALDLADGNHETDCLLASRGYCDCGAEDAINGIGWLFDRLEKSDAKPDAAVSGPLKSNSPLPVGVDEGGRIRTDGGEFRQPDKCTDSQTSKCANEQKIDPQFVPPPREIPYEPLPEPWIPPEGPIALSDDFPPHAGERNIARWRDALAVTVRNDSETVQLLRGFLRDAMTLIEGRPQFEAPPPGLDGRAAVEAVRRQVDEACGIKQRSPIGSNNAPELSTGINIPPAGRCRVDCGAEVVDGICRLCSRTVEGGALLSMGEDDARRLNELLDEAFAVEHGEEERDTLARELAGLAIDLAAWAKKLRAGLVGWMRRALAAEARLGHFRIAGRRLFDALDAARNGANQPGRFETALAAWDKLDSNRDGKA